MDIGKFDDYYLYSFVVLHSHHLYISFSVTMTTMSLCLVEEEETVVQLHLIGDFGVRLPQYELRQAAASMIALAGGCVDDSFGAGASMIA